MNYTNHICVDAKPVLLPYPEKKRIVFDVASFVVKQGQQDCRHLNNLEVSTVTPKFDSIVL
jgi:hypothetical protein